MASSKTFRRRAFRQISLQIMLLPLLIGCYTAEQGFHFLRDQARARSVARVAVARPEYASFLREVDSIRVYAREELGLVDSDSYTTFVELDRDYLVTVVSAVDPLSFQRKLWKYPVVGSVPYKGFYREKAALRTAARLEKAGWDTLVRRVGAFSSLGYFRDPLYSFMTNYHPERLASMLIHEMTHATVWIPGDVPLNEAVATFVGDRGALDYLRDRYGAGSLNYREALRRQSERKQFGQFMIDFAMRLDRLYASDLEDQAKLSQKAIIIAEEQQRFEESYDHWFSDDSYRGFLSRIVNNAYLDLYRTYNTDVELIALLYVSRGEDLRAVVSAFEGNPGDKAPRALLQEWLAEEPDTSPTL